MAQQTGDYEVGEELYLVPIVMVLTTIKRRKANPC